MFNFFLWSTFPPKDVEKTFWNVHATVRKLVLNDAFQRSFFGFSSSFLKLLRLPLIGYLYIYKNVYNRNQFCTNSRNITQYLCGMYTSLYGVSNYFQTIFVFYWLFSYSSYSFTYIYILISYSLFTPSNPP